MHGSLHAVALAEAVKPHNHQLTTICPNCGSSVGRLTKCAYHPEHEFCANCARFDNQNGILAGRGFIICPICLQEQCPPKPIA